MTEPRRVVTPDAPAHAWALQVYRRSVLKQQKYRAVRDMLGDVTGRQCLDVGGDNGVISLLLRARGGEWHSADLDEHTVSAIRALVGDRVARLVDNRLPFPDASFDIIAIVDMLEHLPDDRGFIAECARLLRPGGTLVVNVPHLRPRSLLTRLRYALGLTDEKHGHVRPGYTLASLRHVLAPAFDIRRTSTYCRSCSELIDIALNAAYEWRRGAPAGAGRSPKGTVITQADWSRHRGEMRLLTVLYPLLKLISAGDRLLAGWPGYRLIVRAEASTRAAEPRAAAARATTGDVS